jgi:hypothetical protein
MQPRIIPRFSSYTPDTFRAPLERRKAIAYWRLFSHAWKVSSFIVLLHPSDNAVLFYAIALFQRVPVATCTFFFPIWSGAIDALNGVESDIGLNKVGSEYCIIIVPDAIARYRCLYNRKQVFRTDPIVLWLLTKMCCNVLSCGARKVLGDLDLDIAEIPFSSNSFPFLLVWIL